MRAADEEALDRLYKSTVNEQTNELIVTTRNDIHDRVEGLRQQLDVYSPPNDSQSPIQFYVLRNVKAADMLNTLQSIGSQALGRTSGRQINERNNGLNLVNSGNRNGGSRNGLGGHDSGGSFGAFDTFSNERRRDQDLLRRGEFDSGLGANQSPFGDSVVGDIARLATGSNNFDQVIPGEAKISVDENTNTLIVVAEPGKIKGDIVLLE